MDHETNQQIRYILETFDFEFVHKAMVMLGLPWSESIGIPSITRLKQEARRLLEEVARQPGDNMSGVGGVRGSLQARKFGDSLSLDFVIMESAA